MDSRPRANNPIRLIPRPGGHSSYGTGPDLRFIVKEESLNFLGSVTSDEVPFTIAQYENFVFLPDWPEPCGRSILEASFAGCTLNPNHNCDGARYWLNGDLDCAVFAAEDFWDIVLSKVPVA
jgi:hypothetical protein